MDSDPTQILVEKKSNKNKTLIISGIIVLIVAIGLYFLIPYIRKIEQKKIETQITNENVASTKWLDSQVVPMTEKEKIEIGKNLQKQANKMPKLTPDQNKKIIDFLNS